MILLHRVVKKNQTTKMEKRVNVAKCKRRKQRIKRSKRRKKRIKRRKRRKKRIKRSKRKGERKQMRVNPTTTFH